MLSKLLETFLQQVLGYDWDEVHDEAERLEHVISERFEARIAEALGHPTHDPHGDPIPDEDLRMPRTGNAIQLAELGPVTSLVRYAPGGAFAEHAHPEGEEILVRDGAGGPNVEKLRDALQAIQYGDAADTHGWLTEVSQ